MYSTEILSFKQTKGMVRKALYSSIEYNIWELCGK
jgi:hypothetical protein